MQMNSYPPTVIEETPRGTMSFDIYSRLLRDRILFLGTEVNDHVANLLVAQMLFLQSEDPTKEIHLYINSPGGSITAGLAIYDTMQYIKCPVNTYCMGMAASMGALLLCAGGKGRRYVLPNADVMIHQASGGARGTAADVEKTVEFLYKLNNRVTSIIAHHSGRPFEEVKAACLRDNYLTAEEAKEFGLVDHVIEATPK